MKIKGKLVKEAREDADMNRKALAFYSGLTVSRIWQIETDEESNVNPNIVEAMARCMNTTIEYLEGDEL